MDRILHLYPPPSQEIPLAGAYLAHDLRGIAASTARPFVYANFVTSLDGRIAVPRPAGPGLMVPKTIANPHDWRLYQELAAQADVILSSGRYLREWAEGRAQEILQIDDPRFADLQAWRVDRGLPAQPDIAIISASLDFPIPALLTAGGRKALVVTSGTPDPARVAALEAQSIPVLSAGKTAVGGALLVKRLADLGYRTIYSAAGPRVLYTLVSGGALDRLYLTGTNRILAGLPFATIAEGPLLVPPLDMQLRAIAFDPQEPDGLGQLFSVYDRV